MMGALGHVLKTNSFSMQIGTMKGIVKVANTMKLSFPRPSYKYRN